MAFGLVTWAVSVAYALFQGTLAVLSHSVWFGALAGYYLVLAFLRGGVILRGRKGETEEEKNLLRIRVYRTGGILLIVLTLALSAAVVQMVYANRAFEYAGLMIYASAAYAFYKIIMALYNLVKARQAERFQDTRGAEYQLCRRGGFRARLARPPCFRRSRPKRT